MILRMILPVFVMFLEVCLCWGGYDKVKLKDVEVLTLYHNKMTTGRRSSPVPQLVCLGGTAGCHVFVPKSVQCTNRGSDGNNVHWECKTDMDVSYRFGEIAVNCEGYDYPDDPYILKGSCGLEYTVDHASGYKSQQSGSNYGWKNEYLKKGPSYQNSFQGSHLFVFLAVCIILYAVYKTCLANVVDPYSQESTTNSDYPDEGRRPDYGWFGSGGSMPGAPPNPGFRQNYYDDASCSGPRYRRGGSGDARGGGGLGGFWSGMATGGMLGYMFGNNRNTGHQYGTPTYGSSGFTNPYPEPSSSFGGSSSGTRTTSAFGETRRR